MQISSSKLSLFLQTLAVEDSGILCKLALSKLTHSLFNVYHVFDFTWRVFTSFPLLNSRLGSPSGCFAVKALSRTSRQCWRSQG
jgi:hypothetical protein